jgi:hypothetical protein
MKRTLHSIGGLLDIIAMKLTEILIFESFPFIQHFKV